MMNKKLIASLTLNLLLATSANATDYLLAFGAGGEPLTKNDTIFDSAFKNLSDYTKRNPDLKVDIALNGGHSKTDEILTNGFPNATSKSNFFKSDYVRLLKSYKEKLENNEITSGDQLMIFIDTHGAEKQDAYKTHVVATSAVKEGLSNLNTLSGADLVDLDQLETIKKLAKDKGVKLAIIDASCHSGNTLALADDNTCVISATGPRHYGYGTFAENFANEMTKGKSLEQVFLDARESDNSPNFPMISSPSGLAVNDLIYDKITPFFYHFDNSADKLTPYLEANSDDLHQCLANKNYNSLLETINFAESMNDTAKKSAWGRSPNFSELKKLLGNYKKSLDSASEQMQALDIDRLKTTETIDCAGKVGVFRNGWKQKYTWKELITMDFDKLIKDSNTRLTYSGDDAEKTTAETLIDLYTKSKAKKDQILAANPDLSTLQNKEKEIQKTIKSTYEINSDIAKEERKLYASLYKEALKAQPTPHNACQDFKI